MEEKASFGAKEALLCVAVSSALATVAGAMYLLWSAKRKGDSSRAIEEGALNEKEEPPLTMDQLSEALEQMEFCRMNLMYYEMAVLKERVANCYEKSGDFVEAMEQRLLAYDYYSQVEEYQKAYDVVLGCLSLTKDSFVLFLYEMMCANVCTTLLLPKALEHLDRCEELALSSLTPEANLAEAKCEWNSVQPSKN
jgi:tetratricopeptide (TPR) repeat protein